MYEVGQHSSHAGKWAAEFSVVSQRAKDSVLFTIYAVIEGLYNVGNGVEPRWALNGDCYRESDPGMTGSQKRPREDEGSPLLWANVARVVNGEATIVLTWGQCGFPDSCLGGKSPVTSDRYLVQMECVEMLGRGGELLTGLYEDVVQYQW